MTPHGRGGRAAAVRDWLQRRTETSIARLALLWLRRYLEASRNSGAAASAYFTLSALPTSLVFVAFFHLGGNSGNAFAEHVISHFNLDSATADVVRQTFGSTSDNILAATLAVVVSFLLWGIGIGQLYRDVYARAWHAEAASATDMARFAVWFYVVSVMVGLAALSTEWLNEHGWLLLVPVWLAAACIFWLWTPRYLLRGRVPLRSLVPGALLAAFVIGGTIATSPLWIGPTLTQNAKAFGSFGVVVALAAYILIGITISLVCAVFSPVWFEWRRAEAELSASS